MAIDYDSLDDLPTDAGSLMSYEGAIDSACWAPVTMKVNPSAIVPGTKYTRVNLVGGDLRLYDAGRLIITTLGNATAKIGDLFVEYEIELRVPQVPSYTSGAIQSTGTAARPLPDTGMKTTGTLPVVISEPGTTGTLLTFTAPFEGLLSYTTSNASSGFEEHEPVFAKAYAASERDNFMTVLDQPFTGFDSGTYKFSELVGVRVSDVGATLLLPSLGVASAALSSILRMSRLKSSAWL